MIFEHNRTMSSVRAYVPVNSKTAHSPPGNPRAYDSCSAPYSGEFDPKWGPPCGAFDFRVKTSVSGRKQKDFAILWFSTCTAFTGHCSCRFHVGFSVVVVFISWNMPLFKVWSEDKLNKKFVVAENFAELVSKGKRFCLYSFISWVHGVTEAACHWRVISRLIFIYLKLLCFLAIVFVYIYYSLNEFSSCQQMLFVWRTSTDVVGSPAAECIKQSKSGWKGKSDSAKKKAREKNDTMSV